MKERIVLSREDITRMRVDAIVNAANSKLAGGGGVDGAIHRAAGPELLAACRLLNGCPTGSAKITKGFKLPAKYVIHAVGPVWRGGNNNEAGLLAGCYRKSLELAKENQCKTIAFSNISTGIYGFPKREAAEIAIGTVREFLKENSLPEQVSFVCFDEENFRIYGELV
jgi:O-acetyl-ADP-ribose deacetylase (regulator of RNase III)